MHNNLKVFFTIGDGINWAVDEDLALLKSALKGKVIESNLEDADIIFASWWAPLAAMDKAAFKGKYVVCNMHGDPHRFLSTPSHKDVFDVVDMWFTRSKTATRILSDFGFSAEYLPYCVNHEKFAPVSSAKEMDSPIVESISEFQDKYLIGSFMRDSEGSDLLLPKLVKGPDLLLEIYKECHRRNLPVMLVLGGPRRHWLINQLKCNDLPYHYLGKETHEDDVALNILDRADINLFYNLVDMTIVSSRSEGGPLVLCEAPLANCKIISTSVGMVPDVLDENSIFHSVNEAVNLIEADISKNKLDQSLENIQNKLAQNHQLEKAGQLALNSFLKLTAREGKYTGLPKEGRLKKNLLERVISKARREWKLYQKQRKIHRIWVAELEHSLYNRKIILDAIGKYNHCELCCDLEKADFAFFDMINDFQYVLEHNPKVKKIAIASDNCFVEENVQPILEALYSDVSFEGLIVPSGSSLKKINDVMGVAAKQPVLIRPLSSSLKRTGKVGKSQTQPRILVGGISCEERKEIEDLCRDGSVQLSYCSSEQQIHSQLMETDVYLECEYSDDAVFRIQNALSCSVPVLYKDNEDLRSVICFSGLPYRDYADALQKAYEINMKLDLYKGFITDLEGDVTSWSEMLKALH